MAKPASPLPFPNPQDTLYLACDRVGAGHLTAGGRWGDMTLSKAQQVLRDAVTELIALRSERREMVCSKCMAIYIYDLHSARLRPMNMDKCPKCEGFLRPKAMVIEAALRDQITELLERIGRLEESLTTVLDLGLEDSPARRNVDC